MNVNGTSGPEVRQSERTMRRRVMRGLALAAAILLFPSAADAQGILTLTPGRSVMTTAGTGTVGYSGDNGPATAATLAGPGAIAYDAAGDLFLADSNNHVIREIVKSSGIIVTVAGTGTAGFSGDGASAVAAQLDTPTGVAVDTSGNLYIADSHNQRIREVSGGIITTVAGNGTAGFSGDGAAATATLALPTAVAVSANGTLYIADTNNQRIRMLSGTTLTTVAGTGDQGYTGDGAAATAATLDSPTGIAVDASGNLYIADRHNQRVRVVALNGIITTLAGSGDPTFAGAFGGDGASASAASLSKPAGVSVDAAGNVYIADTNNQRIRQVSAGSIATVEGTGEQGFSADGSAATATTLNAPRAVALDTTGTLTVADSLDQRIRTGVQPILSFAATVLFTTSAAQTISLSNTGTGTLSISTVAFSGPFALSSGSTCSGLPITLAPGASCTETVVLHPTTAGLFSGSVTFSGTGLPTQTIALTGAGTPAASTTTLASSVTLPFVNQSITFTATVKPAGTGVPTGTVTFFSNGTSIGTGTVTSGSASLTTTFTVAGTYSITATYGGNTTFNSSTTSTLPQLVGDFNFTIVSGSTGTSQTIFAGQAATYNFTVGPLSGPFTFPITLSATGLPPGATVTFTPSTITLGASSVNFTMTVQTAKPTAAIRSVERFGAPVLALMLLPFAGRLRRRDRRLRMPLLLAFCAFGLAAFAGLTGCANRFPPEVASQTYAINVIGTASGSSGATLQHVAVVSLTVQ